MEKNDFFYLIYKNKKVMKTVKNLQKVRKQIESALERLISRNSNNELISQLRTQLLKIEIGQIIQKSKYTVYALKREDTIKYIGCTSLDIKKRWNVGWGWLDINRADYELVIIENTDDKFREDYWINYYNKKSRLLNTYKINSGLITEHQI